MNFLGHLALAWPHQNLMVGGFLGDFTKGPLKGDLHQEIEAGIRLHRRIDAKSDCHPAISQIKQQLPGKWRRYAGIVADLYCDHLISDPKNQLSPEPIGSFSETCYEILYQHRNLFSKRALAVFELMQKGRWLEQYADLQFTQLSLARIGTRLKFDNPLDQCTELFENHTNLFDEHCLNLYLDMQKVVAEWHAEARGQSDLLCT